MVIYTSVPEPAFRRIAALLVGEGGAPAWFAQIPYTNWSGATKDLGNVSPTLGAALLLDDYRAYIHPGQEGYWVEASLFDSPYDVSDNGLDVALRVLRERLTALS